MKWANSFYFKVWQLSFKRNQSRFIKIPEKLIFQTKSAEDKFEYQKHFQKTDHILLPLLYVFKGC